MNLPGWPGALGGGPPFVPGAMVAFLLAFVLCGPVARRLGTGRVHAWLLVACVGVILAITLTPSRWALAVGVDGPITCDLSRIGPAAISIYLRFDDPMLNVLMFVPLGLVIGFLDRRQHRLAIAAGAALLPFAIELTQAVVVPLGRACQGGDLFDNLAGLVLGLVIGLAAGMLVRGDADEEG